MLRRLVDGTRAVGSHQLRKPFSEGAAGGLASIDKLSSDLVKDLNPPRADDTLSRVFGYIGQIASGGGSLAEEISKLAPYKSYFSGVAAAMSVVAYLTEPKGVPVLGDDVRAKASELGPTLVSRLRATQSAMINIGLLLVSDRAKLEAAGAKVDSDWKLPPDPAKAIADIDLQTRRWIAMTLAPVAYPYLIRATPYGRGGGPSNARDVVCQVPSIHVPRAWDSERPFTHWSDAVQFKATIGFENDGVPIPAVFFFTRGFDTNSLPTPTDRFVNLLFNSPRAGNDPGLGIQRLDFFTPRTFDGRLKVANQNANYCGNKAIY